MVTNTYSNPLFTDTSSEVTEVCGTGGVCETLAQADATGGAAPTDLDGSLFGNLGAPDDTIWFAPGGTDIVGYDTASQDLLTPFGDFSLADFGGSDVSSLLGGDLLAGLDPLSLLGSF